MMEKEHDRPTSNYNNRYSTQEGIKKDLVSRNEDSIGEFNDEEDFKLSTDQQQSVMHLGAASQSSRLRPQEQKRSSENYMQDRINMQAGIGPASSKAFGEGLRMESNQSRNHLPASSIDYSNENSVLEQSRQKIKESVQYQEERLQRLESSQIKVRQMKNEMDILEDERRKIQMERQLLLNEQD